MTEPCVDAPRPARRLRAPRNWRVRFLAGLAETSNVRAAAQEAEISLSWVYQTKREDDDFAEAWLAALCEGYDRLELELLARLRSGEGSGGGSSGGTGGGRAADAPRRYDNATALRLLLAHRETRARYMAQQDNVSAEAVRASIEDKLARLREQVLLREADERARDRTSERAGKRTDERAGGHG